MDNRNVFLFGQGVVPGIVIGRAHIIASPNQFAYAQKRIAPEQVGEEIQRFRRAVDEAWRQLEDIKEQVVGDYKDPGHILEAHQMMLRDAELQKSIEHFIREDLVNSEWAVQKTLAQWQERFLRVENEYLRERFSDLNFVCARLLRVLSGQAPAAIEAPPPDAIIVAQELSPADAILMGRNAVAGLVLVRGGKTSHTVIIAKAFEIPALVGVGSALENIGEGDLLILNGHKGEIIVNPDARLVASYRAQSHRQIAKDQALQEKSHLPAVTVDGVRVLVMANLDFIDEVDKAVDHGAEGIGLYRSEFLFLVRDRDITDEEVHFANARQLVENWDREGPLTLRTFDMGGDKFPLASGPREPNPALGQRSLRLAMAHPEIFKAQVRGFLRALSEKPSVQMRIMFPLVTSVSEFVKARDLVAECERELMEEGYDVPKHYQVGAMLEVPAAMMAADALSRYCQFFSIGSNDLIQYALAVDRGNERVAALYQGLHPGVLRMIAHAIQAAREAQIDISLCGDLATEPIPALLLLGMGLRVYSMPPVFIPYAKEFLRQLNMAEVEAITREALTLPCAHDIEAFVRMKMGARLQDSFWSEIVEQ